MGFMARETLEPDLPGCESGSGRKLTPARCSTRAKRRLDPSVCSRARLGCASNLLLARSSETQPDAIDEPLSFAPVVITGLGRTPALVLRLGEFEIDVLDPQKVEPRWLAQLIAAAQGGV